MEGVTPHLNPVLQHNLLLQGCVSCAVESELEACEEGRGRGANDNERRRGGEKDPCWRSDCEAVEDGRYVMCLRREVSMGNRSRGQDERRRVRRPRSSIYVCRCRDVDLRAG
jgi:hypothetical protein